MDTKTIHVRQSLHKIMKRIAADKGTNLQTLTEIALEKTYKKEIQIIRNKAYNYEQI